MTKAQINSSFNTHFFMKSNLRRLEVQSWDSIWTNSLGTQASSCFLLCHPQKINFISLVPDSFLSFSLHTRLPANWQEKREWNGYFSFKSIGLSCKQRSCWHHIIQNVTTWPLLAAREAGEGGLYSGGHKGKGIINMEGKENDNWKVTRCLCHTKSVEKW